MNPNEPQPFGTLRTRMMDLQQADNSSSDWSTNSYGDFKSVLFYCAMILGGPIVAFFVTRIILEGPLGYEITKNTEVASAIVAVIVLHIALGFFIVRAYFSGDEKSKMGKSD